MVATMSVELGIDPDDGQPSKSADCGSVWCMSSSTRRRGSLLERDTSVRSTSRQNTKRATSTSADRPSTSTASAISGNARTQDEYAAEALAGELPARMWIDVAIEAQ